MYLSPGGSRRIDLICEGSAKAGDYGTCARKRTVQIAGSHELSACRHGEVEMDSADPDDCLDAGQWLPSSVTVQHSRWHCRLRGWGAAGRSSQVRGVQRAHCLVRSKTPQGPSTYRSCDPCEDTQLRWSPIPACFHLLRRFDELPSRQTHHRLLQFAIEDTDYWMRRGESRPSGYQGLDGGDSGFLCDAQH